MWERIRWAEHRTLLLFKNHNRGDLEYTKNVRKRQRKVVQWAPQAHLGIATPEIVPGENGHPMHEGRRSTAAQGPDTNKTRGRRWEFMIKCYRIWYNWQGRNMERNLVCLYKFFLNNIILINLEDSVFVDKIFTFH